MATDPTPYPKFPHPRGLWFELGLEGHSGCGNGTYSG